jgi:hypothetical protein
VGNFGDPQQHLVGREIPSTIQAYTHTFGMASAQFLYQGASNGPSTVPRGYTEVGELYFAPRQVVQDVSGQIAVAIHSAKNKSFSCLFYECLAGEESERLTVFAVQGEYRIDEGAFGTDLLNCKFHGPPILDFHRLLGG